MQSYSLKNLVGVFCVLFIASGCKIQPGALEITVSDQDSTEVTPEEQEPVINDSEITSVTRVDPLQELHLQIQTNGPVDQIQVRVFADLNGNPDFNQVLHTSLSSSSTYDYSNASLEAGRIHVQIQLLLDHAIEDEWLEAFELTEIPQTDPVTISGFNRTGSDQELHLSAQLSGVPSLLRWVIFGSSNGALDSNQVIAFESDSAAPFELHHLSLSAGLYFVLAQVFEDGEVISAHQESFEIEANDPPPPAGDRTLGCGNTQLDLLGSLYNGHSQKRVGNITVSGTSRPYGIRLPDSYDPTIAYPIVYMFHGCGGSHTQLLNNTWEYVAWGNDEAIVVYGKSIGRCWDLNSGGVDFAYYDALKDHIESLVCAQPSRRYAQGHSSGGYMTHRLGCSRDFRAIAANAGGSPSSGMSCTGPIPVFMSHNLNDSVVPLSQSHAARDFWINRNQCSQTTQAYPRPNGCSDDPTCSCVEYMSCSEPLIYCTRQGPSNNSHQLPSWFNGAAASHFKSPDFGTK
ncbi:MAG: hypothetical protein CL678_16555 [Bdellovibrionaceae bacterium]|nr:hypothetical protein [Pseudobdellovibrionaceae bacterium]